MHKKHKSHVFFTYSEDLYIRQNYGSTAKAKILIALPTRCWESIQARAGKLQISRENEAMLLDRALWNSPRLAILNQFYRIGGPAVVLAELKKAGLAERAFTRDQIKQAAKRFKLRMASNADSQVYADRRAAKALLPVKPKMVPKPTPKLVVVPPLVLLPRPVGEKARTPVLNHRAANKRMTKEQCRQSVSITADAVKKLSPLHPGRQAYTINGAAGYSAWLAGSVS